MKISNNPTELNLVSKIKQQKHQSKMILNHNSTNNNLSDTTQIHLKDSQKLLSLNMLQKKYYQSQNIQGLLSKINSEIQEFYKKTNSYQESIKQIANTLQKTYPKFAQRLIQAKNNPIKLSSEIQSISKEISQIEKKQKQEINHYLVQEQNNDAINNIAITHKEINKLNHQIKSSNNKTIHTPISDLITKLLV